MARRLAAHTGLSEQHVDELVGWLREELIEHINAVVADPLFTHADLSERLANAGVLPMFGFPTRVRELVPKRGGSRGGGISTAAVSGGLFVLPRITRHS